MQDQARRANRGFLGILVFASACAAGDPPTLTVTGPTQAVAGQEVMFTLYGTDPDGDTLQFGWNVSPALPDRGGAPQLTFGPNGEGLFKWTPLGRDVGRWAFEFTVDDGHHRDAVTVGLDVQSASADNSIPSFVKPSGAGTSFDPTTQTCLEIEVAVADQDSPTIEIGLMPPSPTDAMLEVTGGHEATLRWCPSASELQTPSHTFVLSADDGDHEPVEKTFNVVIGDGERPDDDTPGDDSPSDDPDDGGTPVECTPDANESDNSQGEARTVAVCPSGFLSEGNTICAGDEDWFLVQLYHDETVTIRVNHSATDPTQQLDLWMYGPGGSPLDNLTPCGGGACPTYTTQGTFFSHWVNDESCTAELCNFWVRVLGGYADTQNAYSLEVSIDKAC